eukprot:TRINITY_DN26478_c0_g1_i1.p1 TRINITY_DN26478_c0_g1~~TRINITY_DN26478_c0_g1_i1.p1  ORF type:complete len:462 (+),score=182.54 TRINITY_DN26478_c0_g1_i1:51-1388(+)
MAAASPARSGRASPGAGPAASPAQPGNDFALKLFSFSLGLGTRGLGSQTDKSSSHDCSTLSADAAIREYRSKTLERWLEAKEKQIQEKHRRIAAELGEDGGRRYVRRIVPHDWSVLRKKKGQLLHREVNTKRTTLRERLEERREKNYEDLRKVREADADRLRKSREMARTELVRIDDERDGHRKWSQQRRALMLEENQRKVDRLTDMRRRQRLRERDVLKLERETEESRRRTDHAGLRSQLNAHRQLRVESVKRVVGSKCEAVRALRAKQSQCEAEKKERDRRARELLKDRLQRENKERAERVERERSDRANKAHNAAEHLRESRRQLHRAIKDLQDREDERVHELYVESFSPVVVDSVRQLYKTEHGRDWWRKVAWGDKLSALRDARVRVRAESPKWQSPSVSPSRSQISRRDISSAAPSRTVPPRPMSAPPAPTATIGPASGA